MRRALFTGQFTLAVRPDAAMVTAREALRANIPAIEALETRIRKAMIARQSPLRIER